jgi:putative ATP-dependent endonuclease of OLD family
VIRNFRAIAHLDVRLKPGLTCIIGENNTGKTSILHALRLVLDASLPNTFRQLTADDFTVAFVSITSVRTRTSASEG